jgi:hypothetical protein
MHLSSLEKIWRSLKREIIVKGLYLGRLGEILLLFGILVSTILSREVISWLFMALLLLFEAQIIRKRKSKV